MKAAIRGLAAGLLLLAATGRVARGQDTAALSPLPTRWTAQVDTGRPWPEYPRPQLVRTAWMNLNGWWDYAVQNNGAAPPARYTGRILVPFPEIGRAHV